MKRKKIKIKEENFKIFFLFIISTSFFIYQYSTNWSWDFSVYILNAKYWFANGNYFEWLRAPLTAFLLGIFGLMNWNLSPYIYIIFTSFLYLFSCIKFEKTYIKKNSLLFYALMLNPYVLMYGLLNGTELLSLSFILLFFSYLFENPIKSGISLGLASLARYTNLPLILFLLFQKDLKKILISLLFFVLPFLPWFYYNWLIKGHVLTSIGNSFALNIFFRDYIHQPFNIFHILIMTNFLLPFSLLGFRIKTKNLKNVKFQAIVLLAVITLISYWKTPLKEARYLFNLVLPVAYFSTFEFFYLEKRFKILRKVYVLFPLLSIIFLLFLGIKVTEFPNLPKVDDCMVASNLWVAFNWIGKTAEPIREEIILPKLNEGYNVILYKKNEGYEDLNFSKELIVEENNNFIWLRNKSVCKPIQKVCATYLERLSKIKSVDSNPCKVLLPDKICDFFTFL